MIKHKWNPVTNRRFVRLRHCPYDNPTITTPLTESNGLLRENHRKIRRRRQASIGLTFADTAGSTRRPSREEPILGSHERGNSRVQHRVSIFPSASGLQWEFREKSSRDKSKILWVNSRCLSRRTRFTSAGPGPRARLRCLSGNFSGRFSSSSLSLHLPSSVSSARSRRGQVPLCGSSFRPCLPCLYLTGLVLPRDRCSFGAPVVARLSVNHGRKALAMLRSREPRSSVSAGPKRVFAAPRVLFASSVDSAFFIAKWIGSHIFFFPDELRLEK